VASELHEFGARGGAMEIARMALDRIDWPSTDERWFRRAAKPLLFWHHVPWLYAGNKEFDRAIRILWRVRCLFVLRLNLRQPRIVARAKVIAAYDEQFSALQLFWRAVRSGIQLSLVQVPASPSYSFRNALRELAPRNDRPCHTSLRGSSIRPASERRRDFVRRPVPPRPRTLSPRGEMNARGVARIALVFRPLAIRQPLP